MGKIMLMLFALVQLGCAQGHCRRINSKGVPDANAAALAAAETVEAFKDVPKYEKRVYVFRYDGSLQCQKDGAVSLEKMEKQLAPIKVFARQKKRDGLMRIQVCGSATGYANVYEISEKNLPLALRKDFKKWSFE